MPVADLRPLSFGELLDRTFTLYRNHFWLFIGIMAVPQVVIVLASFVLQGMVQSFPGGAPAANAASPGEVGRLVAGTFLGFFVVILLYYLFYSVALGATTFAVADVYFGRIATIRAAYRSMRGRLLRLLGLIVAVFFVVASCYLIGVLAGAILGVALALVFTPLAVLGIFAGLLAGMILGMWVGLRFGVAVPALLLERTGVFQAMTRSSVLTRGHRIKVFLAFLLMGLIAYVAVLIFQGPFLVAAMVAKDHQLSPWLNSLATLCGGLGGALSGPLLMIALSLLYYDLRMRKEAFDLQMMMAALDSSSSPATHPQPLG